MVSIRFLFVKVRDFHLIITLNLLRVPILFCEEVKEQSWRLHLLSLQGVQPSKQRADRRALITERADSGDASSIQNASLPYMPAKVGVTGGTIQRGWLLLEEDVPVRCFDVFRCWLRHVIIKPSFIGTYLSHCQPSLFRQIMVVMLGGEGEMQSLPDNVYLTSLA